MNIYNSFINEILNDINNGNTQRDYLYYETTEAFFFFFFCFCFVVGLRLPLQPIPIHPGGR